MRRNARIRLIRRGDVTYVVADTQQKHGQSFGQGRSQKPLQPKGCWTILDEKVVPLKGLEPPTPSLRMTCSTS